MEIWKDIKDYEELYQVSNLGRIKSLTRYKKILKLNLTTNGYYKISLCKNKKIKTYLVHRLVGIAFIKNPHNLSQINHKDGVKTNNSTYNLEWVTCSQNIKHGFEKGLQYNSNKKEISCSNGMIFESSYEASKWLNINIYKGSKNEVSMSKNIRRATKGYNNYKIYGYVWKDNII